MSTLFAQGSPEYARAFETLLRCLEKPDGHMQAILRQLAKNRPPNARAVDWGAGGGRLTQILCALFDVVYAVEPSASMRERLVKAAPSAIVFKTDIASTTLPAPVDLGLISHVYYHIPDHEWGGVTLRCASQLTSTGALVIVLKHPDTACNTLLEAFGAPRFNILSLMDVFRRHPQYTVTWQVAPGRITTHTFDDTVTIARFMLSDREEAAYSHVPSRQDVETYVRRHLWDPADERGGWDFSEVIVTVGRNPLMSKSGADGMNLGPAA